MKPYIEDRLGNVYNFKALNRKQKVLFSSKLEVLKEKVGEDSIKSLEDLVYSLLVVNYPIVTKEQFEDILDYNAETYGFAETYEILGYIIEDVFTQADGDTTMPKAVNPYLQAKREEKKIQEQMNATIQE